MIEHYTFGTMIVGGVTYQADLKILDGRVLPDWWRKKSHEVLAEDLDDILAAGPDYLVVGQGSPGQMRVAEELKQTLQELRIKLLDQPTAQAIKTFNQLTAQGKKVAAAFHLTC